MLTWLTDTHTHTHTHSCGPYSLPTIVVSPGKVNLSSSHDSDFPPCPLVCNRQQDTLINSKNCSRTNRIAGICHRARQWTNQRSATRHRTGRVCRTGNNPVWLPDKLHSHILTHACSYFNTKIDMDSDTPHSSPHPVIQLHTHTQTLAQQRGSTRDYSTSLKM